MKRKLILSILLGAIILPGASFSSGEDFNLQAIIDAAAPGDVIKVPAGIYRGNFKMKEGVILVGAGAESTVLDGNGSGWVLIGATDSIVKGFTITNAGGGINTNGQFMGIFENIIRDSKGGGIYLGGGGGIVVNNLIYGNSQKAGVAIARSHVLISNNTICSQPVGLSFWKTALTSVVNNIIAYSETGILLDEESSPEIHKNVFWANQQDMIPGIRGGDNIYLDPLLMDPEAGDYRLLLDSPLREMGMPVAGLPEEITVAVGCTLPVSLPLDTYLTLMEKVKIEMLQWQPVVVYELLDEDGFFGVTTRFPRPDFTVKSSTSSTPIEDIDAFDSEDSDSLPSRLVPDDHPAVEVWGWGGKGYPLEKDRYVLDSVFSKPESFFEDKEGNLHFCRKTSFSRIQIVIPEGYEVKSLMPEGEVDPENRLISINNPGRELVEVNIKFFPEKF